MFSLQTLPFKFLSLLVVIQTRNSIFLQIVHSLYFYLSKHDVMLSSWKSSIIKLYLKSSCKESWAIWPSDWSWRFTCVSYWAVKFFSLALFKVKPFWLKLCIKNAIWNKKMNFLLFSKWLEFAFWLIFSILLGQTVVKYIVINNL